MNLFLSPILPSYEDVEWQIKYPYLSMTHGSTMSRIFDLLFQKRFKRSQL